MQTLNIVPPVTLPEKLQHLINTPAIGKKATMTQVSVDTPMDDSQRDFNENDVVRYIAKSQCLDWNLFGVVTVVERSDGSQTMINGQHRTSIVKTLAPTEKTVPAHIIKTDDKEYAAKLFAYLNGVASRNVSREQLLWAEVLAADPDALKMKQDLTTCGLACGRVNAGPNIPQVKRAGFEKCQRFGIAETKYATQLIKQAYPEADNFDILLQGLTRLLSQDPYKGLMNTNIALGKSFQDWFVNHLPFHLNYKEATFPELRNMRWYDDVAFGLYERFVRFMERKGVAHRCPPKLTLAENREPGRKKTRAVLEEVEE